MSNAAQPGHDDADNIIDLVIGQLDAGGNVVPFLQAFAAAGGSGMLSNKDGVVSHGGLLAVVFGECRGEAVADAKVSQTEAKLEIGPSEEATGTSVPFCCK